MWQSHLLLSPLKPGICLFLSADTALPTFLRDLLVIKSKRDVSRPYSRDLSGVFSSHCWCSLFHSEAIFSLGFHDASHFCFLHLSLTSLLFFLHTFPLLNHPVCLVLPRVLPSAFSTLCTELCLLPHLSLYSTPLDSVALSSSCLLIFHPDCRHQIHIAEKPTSPGPPRRRAQLSEKRVVSIRISPGPPRTDQL